MTTTTRISRRIAYGVAGVGVASAIAVGGVATAAPAAPAPTAKVPGTSCTVTQVEHALAKEDPALWKMIESHPKARQHLETALTMTKEQRKAKVAQFKKQHPARAQAIAGFLRAHHLKRPEMKKVHDAITKAEQTCSKS